MTQHLLRIGMVCPYSLTIPGGVQSQVFGLARALRRKGHEVRVLGPCDGPPPTPYVTPLGKSLPTAANGSIAPLAPDPPAALRTARALRDEAFDVIHIHEPLAPGPSMTALTLHAAPTLGTFHAAGRSTSYRLLGRPLRRLLSRLDRRVAVSKDALALVQGHLGGDYEVLYNGVEVGDLSVESAHRVESTHRSSRPAVFFVARHEQRKGLEVLLRAVGMLDRDLECWIAGDGPDTSRLVQAFSHDRRIHWLGRISDAEKAARLRGASVFCAPSLHGESFGVVLLEAMAAATPVVASALDGYQNVATDGVDAVLVPPGDPVELAAALEQVVATPDLADRLVANGHVRVKQFSMDALADRYVEIYHGMLAKLSHSRR